MIESLQTYNEQLEQVKTIFQCITSVPGLSSDARREFFREVQSLLNSSVANIQDYKHDNSRF